MKRIRQVLRHILERARFQSSTAYWARRYAAGGNSGEGSYGQLAEFKAETINAFIKARGVNSVIEFGCGDGNQLRLLQYPTYIGVDVSPVAISTCRTTFGGDTTKRFVLLKDFADERADLAISLDVIFHLVEDIVFEQYMCRLFGASLKHVIIYSSNYEPPEKLPPHMRHRVFTDWVVSHQPNWELVQVIPNRYPIGLRATETSFAHFFIFERK